MRSITDKKGEKKPALKYWTEVILFRFETDSSSHDVAGAGPPPTERARGSLVWEIEEEGSEEEPKAEEEELDLEIRGEGGEEDRGEQDGEERREADLRVGEEEVDLGEEGFGEARSCSSSICLYFSSTAEVISLLLS